MGKVYPAIDGRLRDFLLVQPVFFVATAPAEGHVNVSPQGMRGMFAVLDDRRVAYLDYRSARCSPSGPGASRPRNWSRTAVSATR
jgi:hypothetical protein